MPAKTQLSWQKEKKIIKRNYRPPGLALQSNCSSLITGNTMDPAVFVPAFSLHLFNELTQCHVNGKFDYTVMIIDTFRKTSS